MFASTNSCTACTLRQTRQATTRRHDPRIRSGGHNHFTTASRKSIQPWSAATTRNTCVVQDGGCTNPSSERTVAFQRFRAVSAEDEPLTLSPPQPRTLLETRHVVVQHPLEIPVRYRVPRQADKRHINLPRHAAPNPSFEAHAYVMYRREFAQGLRDAGLDLAVLPVTESQPLPNVLFGESLRYLADFCSAVCEPLSVSESTADSNDFWSRV